MKWSIGLEALSRVQEYRDSARFPRKSTMIWSMDKIGLGYVSMLIVMLGKYQCSWMRVKFLDTS